MTKTLRRNHLVYAAWLIVAFAFSASPSNAEPIELFHVHGLSYSADGKTLYVPAHFGLALYQDGRWHDAPGPKHDYMGFSATRKAFYTSGHPAAGSAMVNPFGLMRSTDQGRTWKQLGMTGEADFHVLATSYDTGVVYVYNMGSNSRMPGAGLYYTTDDGTTWKPGKRQGAPEPFALAVHPTSYCQIWCMA